MGKPVRSKRKQNNETINEQSEPDQVVKDDTSVSDTIEERLRRMELAQSQSSSDVYKFAFFFFMGIVLTLVVYPGVSKALKSLKPNDEHVSIDRRGVEIVDNVIEQIEKENVKENSTFLANVDTLKTEDLMIDETSDENTVDTVDDTYLEIDELEDITGEQKQTEFTETTAGEDLMIDEIGDENTVDTVDDTYLEIDEPEDITGEQKHTEFTETTAGEPLKLTPASPESDTLRVELSPEHVQVLSEETEETNKNQDKKKTKEKGKHTKAKSSVKQAKSTNRNKGNVKDKADSNKAKSKNDAKNNVKDSNAKQKDMPQEIKDFKPTYQKTTVPKKIFADGRRIPPMELLPQKPNNSSVKVWLFDDFLSEQECDGLMRVHNQHIKDQSKDNPILCFDTIATLRKHLKSIGKNVQVTPRDFTDGTTCVNSTFSSQLKEWFNGNWSYSTAFYPGESRFANIFENRIEQAMGLKPANGGKFQITSYPLGIGYKSHTDCMEDSSDQRDRMATVLVYLDTVSDGGETDFPELGIWVRPRKGRALMWNNMDESGKCESLSIHQAKKVVKGHKYIIQRWYYYKSFYSLGKRPPEPPLPVRSPGQPRVSCDEYEYGSCRWYDEWNFEHLIEYEKQKYTLI